ncbi:hypothetical protein XCR_4477 [Xanthomonas campestris pv. raphani 756C]|nr:hypothetical protein XCR_4477 [Xanthomonas campestris pv. raphani 756C]
MDRNRKSATLLAAIAFPRCRWPMQARVAGGARAGSTPQHR